MKLIEFANNQGLSNTEYYVVIILGSLLMITFILIINYLQKKWKK